MKPTLSIKPVPALLLMLILIAGCSSPKEILFANREWHMSNHYGEIIDKDTTYRMSFGNVLIPDPLVIISSTDSMSRYPGMDHFMGDILQKARLDGAEVLFYAPQMQTMFVRPLHPLPPMKPSSISTLMAEEHPYTMWVKEDDIEDWTRESSEMFTYTYFDKGRKQLLRVDHYDYGDTPIAQITILQSANGATSKMKLPENLRRAYWHRDMKHFMRDIEFWSHQVDAIRKYAFTNYKIGQEQKQSKR